MRRLLIMRVSRFSSELSRSNQTKPWTINELAQAYQVPRKHKYVFDPESKLKPETHDHIAQAIAQIKDFDTLFVVISRMNITGLERVDEYPLVHDYSEQFLMEIMPEREDRQRNLLVFYSTVDRRYRLRTGKLARPFLSDIMCQIIAQNITDQLKNEDYDNAFKKLFDLLKFKMLYGTMVFWGLLIFGSLALFVFIRHTTRVNQNERALLNRINKIKEIEKMGGNYKTLSQKYCAICLEKFNASIERLPEDINQPSIESVVEERKRLDSDFTTVEQQDINKDENYVFPVCNHIFHKVCINDWFQLKTQCPICSTVPEDLYKLDRESFTGNALSRSLLNLQGSYYDRYFNRHQVNNYWVHGSRYSPEEMRRKSSGSGGSSSRSYDSGSGGHSGSW